MNRSICGVHFALGIPLALALMVSPARADEQRQGKQKQSQQCEPQVQKKQAKSRAQRKAGGRVRTVAQRKPPVAAQPPAHPQQAQPPAQPAEPPREIERKQEPAPQPMREPEQPPEQGYQPPAPAQPAAPTPPAPMQPPAVQPSQQGLEPSADCVYGEMPMPGINERALCSSLADKAQLQFEEIPGGAAIVITPKPGYSLIDVRRSIDDLEYAVEKGRDLPTPAVQQRCYLFDLYRRTGTLPRVMEGRNMMRLHFTTGKSSEVMPLRTEAYQFACTPPQ